MNNILIAYFSASGVTAKVASELAQATGGELHEIIPCQAYTDADLNWHDSRSRSSLEMKDKASRPRHQGQGGKHGRLHDHFSRLPHLVVCRAHYHQYVSGAV